MELEPVDSSFDSPAEAEAEFEPVTASATDLNENFPVDIPEATAGKDDKHARDKSLDKLPKELKEEIKTVLTYMDQLLESLPEEKIEEFAKSEYFETYKKLFEDLGIVN